MKKIMNAYLAQQLAAAHDRHDGYLMGATGQRMETLKYGEGNWLIECNYIDELVETMSNRKLKERLLKSHMGLNRLKELLTANDLSKTKQIILCHLSNERSDEARMVKEIDELTGVNTIAADVGLIIDTGGEGA